jgi:hypothetical protein
MNGQGVLNYGDSTGNALPTIRQTESNGDTRMDYVTNVATAEKQRSLIFN